ncbi:MAG: T9SS type A sorting domain-containing protein [Bacteroidetes bacterium]|nr:T9SS type A sorting domain-containing protein [Bacteroidales bacterium]MBU1009480.1 T9SS type A sorting domain-containing protein [Bacteroidota bacterium]
MRFLSVSFIIVSLCIQAGTAAAQGVKIGDWRTHLPYQRVIDVEVVGPKTYAATPYDLFVYDATDNSIELLNKVNGLSDIGVSTIRYSNTYKTLLVAYKNTNIDLITESGITNIHDIKDKDLIGNKTINKVMLDDKYAYLSCGFGIVVLNLERNEIHDTYLIGPNGSFIDVLDIAMFNNRIYAATASGIYSASKDSPNLADYNQWTKDTQIAYPNAAYNHLEPFAGKLYVNYTRNSFNADTLFVYDGTAWNYFNKENNSLRAELRASDDRFLVVNNYNVQVYDQDMVLNHTIYSPGGKGIEPQAAVLDAQKQVWIGDKRSGLIKSFNNGFSGEFILPNGPATTSVYELKARGEQVWVASGGRASNWAKLYMVDGIFSYDGAQWKTHNRLNTPAFDTISDFVCVAIDPQANGKAYVGSWQEGVIEFTDNSLSNVYSENNSSLQHWVADPNLVNISGLDFDSYNNLWVANTGANNILSMRNPAGAWKSFNLGSSGSGIDVANMIVDKNNYKWIIRRQEGFLMVFNDNNTIDNPADDRTRVLSSSPGNGGIPGNQVFSMAVDQDGAVWVGTDAGPAVFYSPERIFQQGVNYDAQQILVPRNDGTGQADILLGNEKILAIAVDGSNKKWFGTENGVFLMSKDGLEQIHNFNTDNSPLLSNLVNSIAITDNGEVFFGTGNGIISFKGVATPGGETNQDVYAYPNPVRENFVGPVAIKGLVRDAIVKITDVSGNLVFETRAEGGQAIWDGNTLNGNKVKPGIYLVFVSNSDGAETLVTKIMMMR